MMGKPIRALELYYPMIQFLIIPIILSRFDWSYPVIIAWELDHQIFFEMQTPKKYNFKINSTSF